jgi:hypothetical protein
MGAEGRLSFARVGGLSSVKYKPKPGDPFYSKGTWFHAPPVRRGIFAFTWPYIEPFLVGWKLKDEETKKMRLRRFEYEGPIYAHIKPKGLHVSEVGSWYLIDTSDLELALKEERHTLRKEIQRQEGIYRVDGKGTGEPFLGDPLMTYTKDHLEVFIPDSSLARVR